MLVKKRFNEFWRVPLPSWAQSIGREHDTDDFTLREVRLKFGIVYCTAKLVADCSFHIEGQLRVSTLSWCV